MKISFLIMHAFGTGGTVRTTLTLASELARRHEVEIISLTQNRDTPYLDVDERVTFRPLIDKRGRTWPQWWNLPGKFPSVLMPRDDRAYSVYSLYTDAVLVRALRRLRTDVLIATRPALNVMAARYAPRSVIRIGQEHLHLGVHHPRLAGRIKQTYPRLDALVTVTEADRREYEELLAEKRPMIRAIPNGLPDEPWPYSRHDNRIVAAAGRLVPVKRYDLLLEAFAKAVAKYPDWQLRIYGRGRQRDNLVALSRELGLHNQVMFMGKTNDMPGEFAKASLHVVSSEFEGFGMTILESLRCGVPVISFDVPQGPREIINPGSDGLLVPDGDVDGLAEALTSLMGDEELRRQMGANGRETAEQYGIGRVAERWEALFQELG